MTNDDKQTPATDGHWPVWVSVAGLGLVIGCECGHHPKKRPARMSMQHVPHQAHRRSLKLCPVEYAWPDEATQQARDGQTPLSTGGFVQVRGHVWKDGGWAKAETATR